MASVLYSCYHSFVLLTGSFFINCVFEPYFSAFLLHLWSVMMINAFLLVHKLFESIVGMGWEPCVFVDFLVS